MCLNNTRKKYGQYTVTDLKECLFEFCVNPNNNEKLQNVVDRRTQGDKNAAKVPVSTLYDHMKQKINEITLWNLKKKWQTNALINDSTTKLSVESEITQHIELLLEQKAATKGNSLRGWHSGSNR